MKILDATCGFKGMWYQKNHPFVTFMDKRKGTFNHFKKSTIKVEPDVVSDWNDTPFEDNEFDLILFDPPHIIQNSNKGIMAIKYGVLNPKTWKSDLSAGINELFRVLKPNGIFIFKWCETDRRTHIKNILKLFPYPPLFGTNSDSIRKSSGKIYWIVFIKHRFEKQLGVENE